jgi:predicted ATPase
LITRLRIRGYKSLKEIELTDLSALVVLFGPNAAGKSNLLDALDLLASLAREDTLVMAFQRHRGNRTEHALPVRWLFHSLREADEDREMEFEVDLDLQARVLTQLNRELGQREEQTGLNRPYTRVTQRRLRYSLKLVYSNQSRSLFVTHESLVPLTKEGEKNDSIVPYIKHESNRHRLSVKLERQAHPRFYDLPRSRTLLSEIGDAVNHPHLVAVARELRSLRVYYIEPVRMRGAVADIEASDPGPHGDQLASFYYWLKRRHEVTFKNLIHNLRRLVPGIRSLDVREGAEGFLELWIDEGERGEFPAALVSEGTLRLLCLLGIAATPDPPAIVGYEEPENGVNPARLNEMLSILESASESPLRTQLVLTTHSPSVVDFFHSASRILCSQNEEGTVLRRSDDLPLFERVLTDESLGTVAQWKNRLGLRFERGDLRRFAQCRRMVDGGCGGNAQGPSECP